MPLWPRKVGDIERGLCDAMRQVWVHSRALWLPMEFIEQEARRDLELHGRIVQMDSDEFGAHSVGFYRRAGSVAGAPSTLVAAPGWLAAAPRCRHVSTWLSDAVWRSEESAATTLCGISAANCGLLRAVSGPFAQCDQPPPPLQSGNVALWCERSASGGSASRPFWSRDARPGRPLRAPPMRGPFPLAMAHPPSRWMRGTSVDSRSRRHWCPVCCPTRAPRLPGPPPLTLRPQPKTRGAGSRRPASPRPWRTPSRWRPTQCHTWWERAGTPPG